MRIAIASDDGVRVASHTGRCRRYVIFEIVDGAATRCMETPNEHTAHARGQCGGDARHQGQSAEGGGRGCHQGVLAALADCSALIAGGMGKRLAAGLIAAGVTPYCCEARTVDDAAAAYAAGELAPLSPESACHHHHGGRVDAV